MTPRRFDHDADPSGNDRPTDPDLDRHDLDPSSYRIVRIPDHTTLSRIRYRRDPFFATAINVAYKWLDRAGTPEEVFERYAGRRIRITRNLLDGEYYGGDVEPFVGVVTEDERVDALLDWADETPSPYARRTVPDWLRDARDDFVDPEGAPPSLAAYVDDRDLARATKQAIDEAEEAYREGEVPRREYVAFVADMVEADPVSTPEPTGSTAEDPPAPVGFTRGDVAFVVAVVLILIVLAIVFGVV